MTVRCKFKCIEITVRQGRDAAGQPRLEHGAKFTVVTSGSPENKEFWLFTPCGNVELHCVNQAFEPGREYYFDITPADA